MHVFEQHRAVKASVACRFVLSFYLSRSSWPRTTAFPNLILIQNQPPMVALWVPKAGLFVSVILAPDTWSRHSFSQSNSGPKPAPMVALWVPNAASELEKNLFPFVSVILAPNLPNEPPMVALWVPNAASESLPRSSWPRTPGPATAFPNLILIQNKPPMVALWVPNAASESLEKRSFFPFVSVILAPNTWSRHSFSQSNSAPKRAAHGRTLGAKRCL